MTMPFDDTPNDEGGGGEGHGPNPELYELAMSLMERPMMVAEQQGQCPHCVLVHMTAAIFDFIAWKLHKDLPDEEREKVTRDEVVEVLMNHSSEIIEHFGGKE